MNNITIHRTLPMKHPLHHIINLAQKFSRKKYFYQEIHDQAICSESIRSP